MKNIEKRLREEAKKLLENGTVEVVLAYGEGYDDMHPVPYFAKSIEDVKYIVFNEYCTHNMARYLTEFIPGTKIAIAVKGADSRAVVVLLQEEKIRREDLVIMGIPVTGMKDGKTDAAIDEATTCSFVNPVIYDMLLGDLVESSSGDNPYTALTETEAMSSDERWSFWSRELARCIRCYACRKACPMCYCESCFVDQAQPRWADKSPSLDSNLMFHLTRFYHLAGRCVDCGECSRACPMEIPLYLFHKKVNKECEEMFGQASGMSADDKPVMVDFKVEDSDDILI